MHMLSRKDLKSAELDTAISQNPTTVVPANGEVQTNDEATVYVRELDLLVTVKLLEDTLADLSRGKLCEDHGCSFEWTGSQKPQLIKNDRRMKCSTENYEPIVVPGLPTGFSSSGRTTNRWLSLVYRQAFQAQQHLHLRHLYHRKQQFLHSIPHQQ